ncbi:unnamed protein product [Caenorhabditis sp. 36 PRJEB53466]|nr:unnamed protein product [Caenorhabditis sp. 36 PRJEB53466]
MMVHSSISDVYFQSEEDSPTRPCCIQLSLTYHNTSTKKLAPATKVDQPHNNVILNVIISKSRTSESFSILRFIYRIKENNVNVQSLLELDGFAKLIDDVNAEANSTGECSISILVRQVVDRFSSGDWNMSNRDEPCISSVAPAAPYVRPGSAAAPPSVAPPGSVLHQQPASILQPGSMMGPQSVSAQHPYGMHRMGGPGSMQMNPSSIQQPGSVGMPGSAGGPGSVMNPGSHQQLLMNPGSVGPGSVNPSSVNPGSVGHPFPWNPPSVGQQYHHHQYPPQ